MPGGPDAARLGPKAGGARRWFAPRHGESHWGHKAKRPGESTVSEDPGPAKLLLRGRGQEGQGGWGRESPGQGGEGRSHSPGMSVCQQPGLRPPRRADRHRIGMTGTCLKYKRQTLDGVRVQHRKLVPERSHSPNEREIKILSPDTLYALYSSFIVCF